MNVSKREQPHCTVHGGASAIYRTYMNKQYDDQSHLISKSSGIQTVL